MFIYRKLIFYIVIIFLFSSDINARSIIVDAEIDNLLNQYASELYEVSALTAEEIEIYVVLDPSINASVTPKGKIFINTGLIMESDTPNQVSSIIAHEMGHVINNHHITRRLESQIMSKNQIIAQIIGIGAGKKVDGQVLVLHDLIGMTKEFNPRFLRRYMNLYDDMIDAISNFSKDIKKGSFPNKNEQY